VEQRQDQTGEDDGVEGTAPGVDPADDLVERSPAEAEGDDDVEDGPPAAAGIGREQRPGGGGQPDEQRGVGPLGDDGAAVWRSRKTRSTTSIRPV
jgi:hypothetical protein